MLDFFGSIKVVPKNGVLHTSTTFVAITVVSKTATRCFQNGGFVVLVAASCWARLIFIVVQNVAEISSAVRDVARILSLGGLSPWRARSASL